VSTSVRKISNNSAGDCSILLKFRRDFDHATSLKIAIVHSRCSFKGCLMLQAKRLCVHYHSASSENKRRLRNWN